MKKILSKDHHDHEGESSLLEDLWVGWTEGVTLKEMERWPWESSKRSLCSYSQHPILHPPSHSLPYLKVLEVVVPLNRYVNDGMMGVDDYDPFRFEEFTNLLSQSLHIQYKYHDKITSMERSQEIQGLFHHLIHHVGSLTQLYSLEMDSYNERGYFTNDRMD